jgi:hypothetical protein
MTRMASRIAVLAIAAVILAAPVAQAAPRFFLQVGVPVPVAPVVVAAPAPVAYGPYGYVWRPAYNAWTGYRYQVVPGAWVRPPYARAAWVAPRWVTGPRGAFWARGYWRR